MNDIITLLGSSTSINAYGDTIEALTRTDVFALVESVGMSEMYKALGVGLRPEIKFVLQDYLDYDDQEKVEYGGKVYNIIRTYRTATSQLELTCVRV